MTPHKPCRFYSQLNTSFPKGYSQIFSLAILALIALAGCERSDQSVSTEISSAPTPIEAKAVQTPQVQKIPEGGVPMVNTPIEQANFRNKKGFSQSEIIAVEGRSFNKAIRFQTLITPKNRHDVGVRIPLVGAMKQGDVAMLTFWARGPVSEDESGTARIIANVEEAGGRYKKTLNSDAWVGKDWQQVFLPFQVDFPLDASQISLHLGVHPQVVEMSDFQVTNYGPDFDFKALPGSLVTYEGREPDAPWRTVARERIDKYRKGDLSISVLDASGNPVPGVSVKAAMQRHAFAFGAAVKAKVLAREGSDGDRYREIVEKYFNRVVFENDLKWKPWEIGADNTDDNLRREWVDQSFAWLAERKIEVRGHYVSWGPMSDNQWKKYRDHPEKFRTDLFAHIDDKLTVVGNRVMEWDVINHPVGWGNIIPNLMGGFDFYAEIVRKTRAVVPEMELYVNEGKIMPGSGERVDDYEKFIRFLIDHDATPDGIGFMGHFSAAALTSPEVLWERMDRFAAIIPNLQFTELDVGANGDEELQADYYRDVLITAFAHPAMEGAVMWGFWEGAHWFPERALWRKDWSEKPAAKAWIDQVFHQWWTDETLTTNSSGQANIRGFLGDYLVTVNADGKTLTLPVTLQRDGTAVTLTLP